MKAFIGTKSLSLPSFVRTQIRSERNTNIEAILQQHQTFFVTKVAFVGMSVRNKRLGSSSSLSSTLLFTTQGLLKFFFFLLPSPPLFVAQPSPLIMAMKCT